MRPLRLPLSVASLALVLAVIGCGGGSTATSSPQPVPAPSGPNVTLVGSASYERVRPTASGLDYANVQTRAIRGAVVQVRDPSGQWVWYTAATDGAGGFSITAPASHAITLVVLAALGDPAAPDTRVVDGGGATYALAQSLTTTSGGGGVGPLTATLGWGGSSYTGTRASAPFAILDTIYDARKLVATAAGTSPTFPPLTVNWSPSNQAGTYFSPSQQKLVIMGKANVDTDEFDDHVIAHEWGHYWEDNFGRSDNIGGDHGGNDLLDERVAFGEGFANAFSGFVTSDPRYLDTLGANQATTGVNLDFEADTQVGTTTAGRLREGAWSEASVQELLWDVYDGGPGAAANDAAGDAGDTVALGFQPIYQVMVGAQRTTRAFTTIYSFMDALKTANAGAAAAIATLEAGENIQAHDAFEETGGGRRRCIAVPADGTTVNTALDGTSPHATAETFGAIPAGDYGNKLFNWQWFRVAIPSAGDWAIRATPVGSADLIIQRGGSGSLAARTADAVFSGSERLVTTTTGATTLVFAVGSFDDAAQFSVRCGPAATVSKPAAEATPDAAIAAPDGNG